jgi:hypothetical protein
LSTTVPFTQLAAGLQFLGGLSSLMAASVAVLTWRSVRISARAARSSAETAVYNARHAELRRLHEQFEEGMYFMKMWQLELATSERSLNSDARCATATGGTPLAFMELRYRLLPVSPDASADTIHLQPDVARFTAEEAERFGELFREHVRTYDAGQVLAESFGPPYSSTSADLLGVYSLARALSAWADNHADGDRAERISEITDMFRRELVLTLSRHRTFVARLFRGSPTDGASEYFREHYGLRDDEYSWLFEELALDADRKGLLTAEHRDAVARLECWLYANPASAPLRPDPFPRPDWLASLRPPERSADALPAAAEHAKVAR